MVVERQCDHKFRNSQIRCPKMSLVITKTAYPVGESTPVKILKTVHNTIKIANRSENILLERKVS